MGRGPRWTADEEARLRELFADGLTDLQIAALMHREEKAVKGRRWALGLHRERKKGFQKRRWLVVGGIGFEVEEGR